MAEIVRLEGPDHVRKRPEAYWGSGPEACKRMVLELIDYAIQEHQLGFADHISITMGLDGSYTIEFDSGIPMEHCEETFCGVFPKKEEYTISLMSERTLTLREKMAWDRFIPEYVLFAANAASEFMTARVIRNGNEYTLRFQEGLLSEPISKVPSAEADYTSLNFAPDESVFSSVDFRFEDVSKYAAEQAALNPGLEIAVSDTCTKKYYYENGLAGLLEERLGPDSTVKRFCWDAVVDEGVPRIPPYKAQFEVAFGCHPTIKKLEYYHNHQRLECGGVLRAAVSESVCNLIERGAGARILNQISIFISTTSERTRWEDARHTGIVNSGIYTSIKTHFQQQLRQYIEELAVAQQQDRYFPDGIK